MVDIITGSETLTAPDARGQVYHATHDGAGNRLPYMLRSFISFSYGNRWIEDFGLIAVIDGDRLSHAVYADFSDITNDPEVYDGQHYWDTHFKANAWDLTLSTDGMTERQLDDFRAWFKPGQIKELVLAEHPNRAILARVSNTPNYNMIPFEEKTTVKIAGTSYNTSTTLYKGDITLSFVMDYPFWYARADIMDVDIGTGDTITRGKWIDANGNLVNITECPDALKIISEDFLPTLSMISHENISALPFIFGVSTALTVDLSNNSTGSRINYAQIDYGRVAYALNADENGIANVSGVDNCGYFFYGGTAPCSPTLVFDLTPTLNNNDYIDNPRNSFAFNTGNRYNTITIESVNKYEFKFTTPSVYTAYNQIINILKTTSIGISWEELRTLLRNQVKHYAPRAYVFNVIDNLSDAGVATTQEKIDSIIAEMPLFLKGSTDSNFPVTFTINSRTGEATAAIKYWDGKSQNLTEIVENVGDMIKSNYLIIKDRNEFDEDGYIQPWDESHPQYSYRIYTDVVGGIQNLQIKYKYQYL